MSAAVILNPFSGGGRGLRSWEAFLQSTQGQAFHSSPTFRGEKHALKSWIQEQYSRGTRDWVVAGGDGTVHLAINLFVELGIANEIRVGAVGVGSSNDFHKPFDAEGHQRIGKIPTRLEFSQARKHDLGRVYLDGANDPIYFAVNSSVGVTAEANLKFNQASGMLALLKKNWTDGAIVATALKTFATYRNHSLAIGIEDQPVRVFSLTNAGFVKNRFFSGSFRYDEAPAVNDGMLGFFLCRDMNKGEMLKTLMSLSQGHFKGIPKTEAARVKAVDVGSPSGKSFCVETDGEVSLASKARYDVLREAIALCP